MQVKLDVLENSDNESLNTARKTCTNPRVLERQRKKPGRKINKPTSTQNRECGEKDLSHKCVRKVQTEDESLSFIINLKQNGHEKPNWTEISAKRLEIKFWFATWQLLEIQNELLCLKWYYSETEIK